ncbi:hypothetical protein [Nostoc sp. NMS8]|uniref:hypothetical protein n=1 Tax=Nostoc sp. NMS8 TaxID=2815392 RepID=UPI0025E84513|nr:hypothetical protein [Nostoc sp. NMS8]MBN3959959.1 hypothetical protein [Nostoc sp. NMS8]
MKQSQRLGLLNFTLVRSQSNRKGWDCFVVPPLYETLRERNDRVCHCECSASGIKQSQRLGLLNFTLVQSQSHQ